MQADLNAAGIFNLGLMAGIADDAGYMEKTSGNINVEMRSVAGASVTEMENTYSPVFSVNFAYINDSLFIKTGWEYTSNVLYNTPGSINGNEVELNYTRFTLPVSIGLVVPLTVRDRIYFSGGLNVSYVLMKIKQSNPGTLSVYPGESHSFPAYISGSHIKTGAETLVSRNYSFSLEFTKYFSNTKRVKSEDKNAEAFLGVNSFEITAGMNYNIDFKI
jgi:hypothetical protein